MKKVNASLKLVENNSLLKEKTVFTFMLQPLRRLSNYLTMQTKYF